MRACESGLEGQIVAGDAHAFAAAAGGGLDEHGEADFVGRFQGFVVVGNQAGAAWHHGHLSFFRHAAGRILVAQGFHGLRCGADEVDLAAAADLVEMGIFREESVTRMDRFHVAHFGCADDLVDLEVAVGAARGPDANGFIRQLEVLAASVGRAVDADSLDPQLLTGADDSQGDFAAVGDENAFIHAQEG